MAEVHRYDHLTGPELARLAGERTVAVLPVGAVEQHGPHLPLGTDSLIAEGLVARALDRLDGEVTALLLPLQAIGVSVEHGAFAGTLSHEPESMIAAWSEIGASLAASGIRKLVILNAHGGQPQVVDIVAQRLRARHAMLVVRANYLGWPVPEGTVPPDEHAHGYHGGMLETSIMLALYPELVRMSEAKTFPSRARELDARHRRFGHGGRLGFSWMAEDLNAEGVVGDAGAATAEIGEALLEHHAATLAALIADAADFDREGHFGVGR